MTLLDAIPSPGSLLAVRRRSPAEAKARLLDWADAHDAEARKSRSGLGRLAIGGALAVLGTVVISRLASSRRGAGRAEAPSTRGAARLISWALVARVGMFVVPRAIQAIRNRSSSRAAQR